MPRQTALGVDNNFIKGLITQSTGLNFPENASTETFDCIYALDGSVTRRGGFDYETSYSTKNIDRSNVVVTTYLWKNVAGDGNVTLWVVQIGATIYFYKSTGSSLSAGAVSTTVTLTAVSGADDPANVEAQFCDGNGYLIITHPYCEPIRVSYNTSTDTATATNITIKIRDFEGAVADSNAVDTRPTATLAGMNVNHKYNLYNQGWNTTNLTAWDTAQTTMPSNADVMWRFKDADGAFSASSTTIANTDTTGVGNTTAPKGHFILTLSNQDRDTAAGTTGVAATTTGHQRPSTSAFFAGRVFYSGISYTGVNHNIYFTQIIENTDQYGFCYQVNDPTAEDLFDLLPSDGGVIKISDAGTIFKLFTIPGGLAVFAANGIWFITGNTGIGFTANDYSVQKIANIPTISAQSIVNVAGYPMWWNAEGIYVLTVEGNTQAPTIKPLTYTSIKDFYDDIPVNSKRYARGFYNNIDGVVQWLYRSESTDDVTSQYEFDRVLNYNIFTGAFYPWTISDSSPTVNGIVFLDFVAGSTNTDTVVDGTSQNVIDASSNQVISFSVSSTSAVGLTFKYLTSYVNGSTYTFTVSEATSTRYLDWYTYDTTGIDYTSYFICGYKVTGKGILKFQPNWVKVFSRINNEVQYYFRGIWDYAISSNTGRWSVRQHITHNDTDYSNGAKRLKVRGRGSTLQFKVESVTGYPFDIIGWSNMYMINGVP